MRLALTSLLAGGALAVLLGIHPVRAAEPVGNWVSDGGRVTVRLSSCGGALCGTIVSLKEATDSKTGRPKTDKHNADASKRDRPMLGLPVVLSMKPTGSGKWSGKIYNAEDGKTYAGHITKTGERSLKVEGCAMAGLICRAQNWTKAS